MNQSVYCDFYCLKGDKYDNNYNDNLKIVIC